jgi:hypothetical protein
MTTTEEVIRQIDRALAIYKEFRESARYDDLSDLGEGTYAEANAILTGTIDRIAPPGPAYRNPDTLRDKIGVLRALRRDYAEGFLTSVKGLVRAEVFADFLMMAEHLLETGYKDPSAVLVGGVLEEHLRALCVARSISIEISGKPKKADAMNNDLSQADVYNKLDQKNVTAWLDLRNKAAHGQYDQYTREQVATMLSGVTEFTARNKAG